MNVMCYMNKKDFENLQKLMQVKNKKRSAVIRELITAEIQRLEGGDTNGSNSQK